MKVFGNLTSPQFRELVRKRFILRDDTYWVKSGPRDWKRVPEPLTDAVLDAHLQGAICISIDPVRDGLTKVTCWDFDSPEVYLVNQLTSELNKVFPGAYGIERTVRGWHVWLFYDPPAPVQYAIEIGEVFLRKAKIQAEYYPSHYRPARFTHSIRLPFGYDPHAGIRTIFYPELESIKPVNLTLDLITHLGISIVQSRRKRRPEIQKMPCIDLMLRGVDEGVRDEVAFFLARYYWAKGLTKEQVEILLTDWNKRNHPPLDEKQLIRKIQNAFAKGYLVGCESVRTNPLLVQFCRNPECYVYQVKKQRIAKQIIAVDFGA